jgi:sulfite exporter TauE/SafE
LLTHHLAFHAGRIISYGILGAFVAGLIKAFEVQRFSMQYRGGFSFFSGLLLLVLGLVVFGLLPIPPFFARLTSSSSIGRRMAALANSPGAASKIYLGLAAGLIPCGLTWAMLVTAASTLNPVTGFVTMASFGLGTIPLLMVLGVSASFFSARIRLLGERTAAAAIIVMGIILLYKGTAALFGTGCCH